MNKKQKVLISLIAICILFASGFGYYAYDQHQEELKIEEQKRLKKEREEYKEKVTGEIYLLFSDEEHTIPKDDLNLEEINKLEKKVKKVYSKKERKKLQTICNNLKSFVNVKEEINTLFQEGTMISSTSEDTLNQLQGKIDSLVESYRGSVQAKLDEAKNQFNNIKSLREQIRSYFTDDSYSTVANTVYRSHYDDALNKLNALPQKDIVDELAPHLEKVLLHVEAVEAEAARIEEERRQAALAAALAESQRIAKENAEIAAANYEIGGIPYISQVTNQVFNGCEAASLLMGLQYRGIATGTSLAQIATDMPKHDSDPHQGFIHSIFGYAPTNVPHWIAPDALTAFGQKYYGGVTNISGTGADGLYEYLDNGSPVIVYGTYAFRNPTGWTGEVPNNLHVMLLTGYNKKTGNLIIHDPWAGKINVSKDNFANIYNMMKFAVAIQ